MRYQKASVKPIRRPAGSVPTMASIASSVLAMESDVVVVLVEEEEDRCSLLIGGGGKGGEEEVGVKEEEGLEGSTVDA